MNKKDRQKLSEARDTSIRIIIHQKDTSLAYSHLLEVVDDLVAS